MSTEIERIYVELESIRKIIEDTHSPSDAVAFESIAAKSMLLACASYFEKVICEMILDHVCKMSRATTLISFVDAQALKLKYHTLFEWKQSNINKFIKLFGNRFYDYVSPLLQSECMKSAVSDFLLLGLERNKLVHQNFSDFPMQLTLNDIKGKFNSSLPLVSFFAKSLEEFEHINIKDFSVEI